jgi:SAPK-interacting protein 1 (Sin1), Pleckstrin-homology
MPTTNKAAKAVFDSGKTSSYHIDSVVSCQSGKSSSAFRMVVLRDGGNKRYEFEAESAKLASAFHHRIFILSSIMSRLTARTIYDRRDCTDYQRSQVCVGTHRQYHWQISAEQTNLMIRSLLHLPVFTFTSPSPSRCLTKHDCIDSRCFVLCSR